jgi:hypothetical protein
MDTPTGAPLASDRPLQPGWMSVLAALCAATVVVSVVRDLFFPASQAVEVWFGFEITGWLALATAPIHWVIFATAAWAFWTGRSWIAPWAAGYLFYAAISHVIWSEVSPHGRGWPIGVIQGLALSAAGYVLLQLRALDAPR